MLTLSSHDSFMLREYATQMRTLANSILSILDNCSAGENSRVQTPPNDYKALIRYMESRDGLHYYLARAKGKYSQLANMLTREIGWAVNPDSLSKAVKRMKK